jgi:hypothetical protein
LNREIKEIEEIKRLILFIMQKRILLQTFFQESFYVLLAAIVVFGVLELFWPRLVLAYININWLLIGWVVSGIVVIIVNDKPLVKK